MYSGLCDLGFGIQVQAYGEQGLRFDAAGHGQLEPGQISRPALY